MTDIKDMFTFVEGDIEVDIIEARGFNLAREAMSKAVSVSVFGKEIKVAVPEYLIVLKLAPFEGQDVVDIKRLARVANIDKTVAIARRYMLLPKLQTILNNMPVEKNLDD